MVPSIFGENLFDEFWNDPFDMDRMLPRGRDPALWQAQQEPW